VVPFEYGRIKLWKLLQKLFYIDEIKRLNNKGKPKSKFQKGPKVTSF